MSKRPPSDIDPTELMSFLETHEVWPTNGLKLSQAAREQGRPDKLVHLLEHIPGQVESPDQAVQFAMEESGLDVPMETGEEAGERELGDLDLDTVKETGGD